MNSDLVYTLLIIGEEDAGKNIFLLRFTDKEIYRPIQFRREFKITRITINDSIIKLKIWDAPGQEKFRTRTNKFFNSYRGIFFIYNIDISESYMQTINNYRRYKDFFDKKKIKVILIGNKVDKEGNREVTYEKAENFAKKNGILFREINCINGNGIEEAFNDLVMEILYEDGLASPLRAIMLKKQKVEKKKKCI